MKNLYTPGPWSAHHDHGWLVVESSNEELYIKIEKGSAATKHMADAMLIAASPELLAALQTCLDYGSMTGDEHVIDKARAAIAKATGAKV